MKDDLRVCRNCQGTLAAGGEYCPHCGQKAMGLPTLRELFAQFADDVLSLDSKFLRTYGVLIARPGHVTKAYLAGARQRYVKPLRLYLVNSLLFFLVASWSGVETVRTGDVSATDDLATAAVDTASVEKVAEALRAASFPSDVRDRLRGAFAEATLDSSWVAALAPEDSVRGYLEGLGGFPVVGERLRDQGRRLETMSGDQVQEALNDGILRNLPKAIFAMVPVFAAVLALVYRRRGIRYAGHFVFALHGHALAFLVFMVPVIVTWTPLEVALTAGFPLHAVWSLRTVYGQGWIKTVVKAVLITVTYTVCLFIALLAATLVSLLTL